MDTTSKVQAETAGFIVSVVSDYDEILSNPLEPAHFYNYKINIFNKSGPEAQLISRYWQITDANGIQNEVRGSGVVGKQPFIKPGEFFEYKSFCILPTEFGLMQGIYDMKDREGSRFEIVIPPFRLLKSTAVQ